MVASINSFTKEELEEAVITLSSLMNKCQKALIKLVNGTSQHTLLKNRIKALHIAIGIINETLQQHGSS